MLWVKLERVSVMRLTLNLLAAVITFLAGLALGASYLPALMLASLIGLAVPLTIMGLVLYQGLILGRKWRPAVGKATLGLLLWSIPSYPIVLTGFLVLTYEPFTVGPRPALSAQLLGLTLVAIYGLAGLRLCLWVNRYDAGGGHWLYRSRPIT